MKKILILLFTLVSTLAFCQKKMTVIFTIEYNSGRKIDSIKTYIVKPERKEIYSKNFVNTGDHFLNIYKKFIEPKMKDTKSKNAILRDLFIKDKEWQNEQQQIFVNRQPN